jgi:regulator of sigma E protease
VSWALAVGALVALVIIHEVGHFIAAKALGFNVERFSIFFGPPLLKFRRNETEYRLATIPLGGYVKVTGQNLREESSDGQEARGYFDFSPWRRAIFVLAGPAANVVAAFMIAFGALWIGGLPTLTHGISSLGDPAARYLRAGDVLVSVDGKRGSPGTLALLIQAHQCSPPVVQGCRARSPAILVVNRDGKTQKFKVRPTYDQGLGHTRVGIQFQIVSSRSGLVRSAADSGSLLISTFTANIKGIANALTGHRQNVSSVVGVVAATHQAVSYGAVETLLLIAVISLGLAIVNLLPLLPLDGGHLVWIAAEKIRGRRIPQQVVETFAFVGLALVLIISFIAVTHDVQHLGH